MELGEVIVVILLCLGAAQGLFYGFILSGNRGSNRAANRLLAFILFFLAYVLVVQVLRLFGIGFYDFWYHILIDYSWIYGPLIYLYVRALLTPDFQLERKDWIHFLPVGIQIVCSVFVRSQSFFWDGTRESLSWLGYWAYVVWMNYSTVYLMASILIVTYAFKARQLVEKTEAQEAIEVEATAWIKRILQSFIIYFSLVLVVLLIDLVVYNALSDRSYFYFTRFYFYPFFLGLSALTYWLGFEGYKRKDLVIVSLKPKLTAGEKIRLKTIAAALRTLMQKEKVYTNPNLSLALLAERLDVKPYVLSKCLKVVFQQKFNDYINRLRIEDVKRMMLDPAYSQYTLLSLAFDAGFNSKSSFNRAVVKLEGVTPSELKARL